MDWLDLVWLSAEVAAAFSQLICSDDACQYGYLIPANMFASVVLGYVKTLAKQLFFDDTMFFKATKLKLEIEMGLKVCAEIFILF